MASNDLLSCNVGCIWTNWINRDQEDDCCDDEELSKVNPCTGTPSKMEARKYACYYECLPQTTLHVRPVPKLPLHADVTVLLYNCI